MTTSATVIAQSLCNSFNEAIRNGNHPIDLKNKFEKIAEEISKNLIVDAKEVSDKNIEEIATISANNDRELGKLIADAFMKVTRDGVITIEDSNNTETSCKVVNGMQFERGFVAPHFVTDSIKNQCILENPFILITDQKIHLTRDIIPILEPVSKTGRPILIIAQEYDAEVIENMKLNHMQGLLKCCLINCPSFGEYRKEVLEDLAILTGGQYISHESGELLNNATIDQLGQCKKVIVDKEHTTIVGGNLDSELMQNRIAKIREEIKVADPNNKFINEFLRLRLARLMGGVCVIHVGGQTEIEMKERKDRIEDAVCAVRAALEEGVVAGGGVNFMNAVIDRKELIYEIVNKALFSVFEQLSTNAGIDPSDSHSAVLLGRKSGKFDGIDFQTSQVVDMFEAGIINPAKADRLAWEAAVSIANLFLQTNCVIVPEDDFPVLIK